MRPGDGRSRMLRLARIHCSEPCSLASVGLRDLLSLFAVERDPEDAAFFDGFDPTWP